MRPNWKTIGVGLIFAFSFLILELSSAEAVLGQSTISGTVYDKQRNALPDMEVELLNDYYQMIKRARTDGTGRYQFDGLSNGRYTVRVYAFRYDLEDHSEMVEINTQNIRGGEGVGFFLQDFYLVPKKGGLADAELGVVFAQEIPPEAKKMYERAINDLAAKRKNDGIGGLHEAVKAFPEYYVALHRIGKELFIIGNYKDAVPYLLKAVEVNTKSGASFYYLGYSLHNLGKQYTKAAITSLTQAHVLAPNSLQILYVLGKAERSSGKFAEAEKHLLQAKKLSKIGVAEIHKELAQLYADDLHKYNEAADELEFYLKASKLNAADEKQTKKVISSLREKAKTQSSGI